MMKILFGLNIQHSYSDIGGIKYTIKLIDLKAVSVTDNKIETGKSLFNKKITLAGTILSNLKHKFNLYEYSLEENAITMIRIANENVYLKDMVRLHNFIGDMIVQELDIGGYMHYSLQEHLWA